MMANRPGDEAMEIPEVFLDPPVKQPTVAVPCSRKHMKTFHNYHRLLEGRCFTFRPSQK
jgi:hypothetical protein